MSDWAGVAFFIVLILGAIIGLRIVSKPRVSTSDEFEERAAETASFTGALLNALHGVTDPGAARGKEVRMQMKDGRYLKKKREGKSGADENAGENDD